MSFVMLLFALDVCNFVAVVPDKHQDLVHIWVDGCLCVTTSLSQLMYQALLLTVDHGWAITQVTL